MYDRSTVQGATFNMRGQLYRGHTNAIALFSSPVVSALGSKSDNPGSFSWPEQGRCALETCGEKMRALLLGLAKSIYYFSELVCSVLSLDGCLIKINYGRFCVCFRCLEKVIFWSHLCLAKDEVKYHR